MQFERICCSVDLELCLRLIHRVVKRPLVFDAKVTSEQGSNALLSAIVLDLETSNGVLENRHGQLVAFVEKLLAQCRHDSCIHSGLRFVTAVPRYDGLF